MKAIVSFIALLLIIPFGAQAQTDGLDLSSPDTLFGGMEMLYGALVVIGGYISAFIPGINKIDNSIFRVLAWAILTGLGFFLFGGKVLSLALTYAASTSIYEIILKWIIRSPKPSNT